LQLAAPSKSGNRGNAIILRANAEFFGQKPAAKSEKSTFLYLINEKNGIHSIQRDEVPEIRIFY